MVVMRSTYYSAWKLSQAGMNFCGLSYNKIKSAEENEEGKFDKIEICNLHKI